MSRDSAKNESLDDSEDSGRVVEIGPVHMHAELRQFSCLHGNIEDLSDVGVRIVLDLILNALFRGLPKASQVGERAIIAFIRSSDKAVAEYQLARAAAAELDPSGPYSALFRVLDHFETCIFSVARCHRVLRVLKANLRRPGLPKQLRVEIEAFVKGVKAARNACEHIEGELSKVYAAGGGSQFLFVSDSCDGLVAAEHTITFAELATLLRSQHELSRFLANYAEGVAAEEGPE